MFRCVFLRINNLRNEYIKKIVIHLLAPIFEFTPYHYICILYSFRNKTTNHHSVRKIDYKMHMRGAAGAPFAHINCNLFYVCLRAANKSFMMMNIKNVSKRCVFLIYVVFVAYVYCLRIYLFSVFEKISFGFFFSRNL